MIPQHVPPEELASIRYVASTCDGPGSRAIGNLIRSLANDLEQWQNAEAAIRDAAADIWDEGEKAGYIHGQHDTHRFDPGPDYTETPNPYRKAGE